MTIVLDTGALIALDRGSRTVLSRLQTAFDKGDGVQVPAGVIGQAWRELNQHALLSRALKRCDEVPSTDRSPAPPDNYAVRPVHRM